jgi:large subunit ribosomal protein L6
MEKTKKIIGEIEIPEGITLEVKGNLVSAKGPKGETSLTTNEKAAEVKVDGNKIIVTSKNIGKKYKKQVNTIIANIKNIILGVNEGFAYKLKVCSGHFPMNVSIGNGELVVKNYFGEKIPRNLKLKPGVEVKLEGDIINVTGTNKNLCGQVAADIEKLASRRSFDRRIFQDGIYIIEKAGKKIQ